MDPSRILYQLDPVTPTTYDEQSYRDLAQHTANWKFEYTHLGLEVDQTQWLLEQQTLNSFAGLENPPPSFNYNVFPAAQKVQSATPLSSAVPAKRRRLVQSTDRTSFAGTDTTIGCQSLPDPRSVR